MDKEIIVLSSVAVIILVICLIIYMLRKDGNKDEVIEHLDTNQQLPTEACDVNYVEQQYQDACATGDFKESYIALTALKGQKYADQIADRAKSAPDSGLGCAIPFSKFGFKTYQDTVMDYTNTSRNNNLNDRDADGNPTNITTNWAKCFSVAGSAGEAQQNASHYRSLANGTVVSDPQSVPVGGKPSTRITFNNIEYNNVKRAFCSLPPPTGSFNSSISPFLAIVINPDMKVLRYGVQYYENNKIMPYMDTQGFYEMLFDIQAVKLTNGYKVVVVTKEIPSAKMYKFKRDVCGRIESKTDIPFSNFRLSRIFNAPSGTFYDIIADVPNRFNQYITDGSLTNLDNIVNTDNASRNTLLMQKNAQLSGLQQQYDAATKTQSQHGGFVWRTLYNLTKNVKMNTKADLDNVFSKSVRQIAAPETHDHISVSDLGNKTNFATEFIGYFKVPETSNYFFKVRSHDASDMFIGETNPSTDPAKKADILVASYYGLHPLNDGGRSEQGPNGQGFHLEGGQLYKLYVRLVQGTGSPGIQALFRNTNSYKSFREIMGDNLWHDHGDDVSAITNQMNTLKKDIDDLKRTISENNNFLYTVRNKFPDTVVKFMNAMVGQKLSSLVKPENVSTGNTVYLYVGIPVPLVKGDVDDVQDLSKDTIDISKNYTIIPYPKGVDFTAPPVYTISMWVKVDSSYKGYRPLIFYGTQDEWNTYWKTGDDQGKVDRTPGIFIAPNTGDKTWPNDGKVRIKVAHRVAHPTQKNAFNWGVVVSNTPGNTDTLGKNYDQWKATAPDFNKWFHFAVVVNRNEMSVYVNGKLVGDQSFQYDFEWNSNGSKKMYVGINNQNAPADMVRSSYYVQQIKWQNSALSAQDIVTQMKATPYIPNPNTSLSVPTGAPKTIDELNKYIVSDSGIYSLIVGQSAQTVYVNVNTTMTDNPEYQKWIMIMNYTHRGNTSPNLNVRKVNDGLPMENLARLGTDGSTTLDNWGHASNAFLRMFNFNAMRFYATNGKTTVHFILKNQTAINYFRYGYGSIPALQKDRDYILMKDHNAPMPAKSNVVANMGDAALTYFPFNIFGVRANNKWQVGNDASDSANTIHKVYITLVPSLPEVPTLQGCTIGGTAYPTGTVLQNGTGKKREIFMVGQNARMAFPDQDYYNKYISIGGRPYSKASNWPNLDTECTKVQNL